MYAIFISRFEENPKKMGRIYGPIYGALGPQLGPIIVNINQGIPGTPESHHNI